MTRIRYFKVTDGHLKSKEILLGNDAVVVNLLSTNNGLSYTIVSVGNSTVVEQGNASSLHMLKKKVKYSLKTMGKTFNDEIRKKREHQLSV